MAPMNDALPVDYKQCPFRSAVAWAIRAIKLRHFPFRLEIGKERKMQPAIAGKRGMAPRSINRNAHNLCAQFLKLREHLVIKAHLISADGTPVGWIKNQDDWLPPKLAQSHDLIGVLFRAKSGASAPAGKVA